MLAALSDIMLYTPKLQSFAFALQFQILAHSLPLFALSGTSEPFAKVTLSAADALQTV